VVEALRNARGLIEAGPDPGVEPPSAGPRGVLRRAASRRTAWPISCGLSPGPHENEDFRQTHHPQSGAPLRPATRALLLKFIDILDNLDRPGGGGAELRGNPLIQGSSWCGRSSLQTLQRGLERIPVLGLPYDPNFSEAVATQAVENAEHHHVVVKDSCAVSAERRVPGPRGARGEFGRLRPPPRGSPSPHRRRRVNARRAGSASPRA